MISSIIVARGMGLVVMDSSHVHGLEIFGGWWWFIKRWRLQTRHMVEKINVINIDGIFCINDKGPFAYDGVHINELEGSSIAMKWTIF